MLIHLKHQLEAQGSIFQTSSDTEVLAHLIETKRLFKHVKDQVKNALSMLKGAYAYLDHDRNRNDGCP